MFNSSDLSNFFENDICFNFRRTSKPLTNLYNRVLKEEGHKIECTGYYLLISLYNYSLSKKIKLTDLAQNLLTDRTTITRVIKPLEENRLVILKREGKMIYPILTDAGRKVVEEVVLLFNEIDRYIKVELSNSQKIGYSDFPNLMKKVVIVGDETAKIRWNEIEEFVCRFFNEKGYRNEG